MKPISKVSNTNYKTKSIIIFSCFVFNDKLLKAKIYFFNNFDHKILKCCLYIISMSPCLIAAVQLLLISWWSRTEAGPLQDFKLQGSFSTWSSSRKFLGPAEQAELDLLLWFSWSTLCQETKNLKCSLKLTVF